MTKQEVLNCFWLPKGYINDCSSGANEYTIRKYDGTPLAEENQNEKLIREILISAKRYHPEGKKLKKNQELGEEFVQTVNDALNEIYSGNFGLVFSKVQAITVCSFLSQPEIKVYDGYYYINQK